MQDRTARATAPELERFAIGQPALRGEDDTLLRGQGRYTDDLHLPGQAYQVMVRSTHAHGIVRKIDIEAARAMPGVLAVVTQSDLKAAGYGTYIGRGPLKNRDGSPLRQTQRPLLASDKVRFVGDPIAAVVAQTLAQARDAAEAVVIDIEPLPAVTRPEDAVKPGAPLLYADVPDNIVLDFHSGDSAKVAEAFSLAAHVTRLDLVNSRVVVSPIEPRAALADYDPSSESYTLRLQCQGVAGMRTAMAEVLNIPREKMRVMTGHVGGSFGMKQAHYPEYQSALYAAKALGRPVKWTDERSGSFLSDHHGRSSNATGELALAADGTILALRLHVFANLGAYIAMPPIPPTVNMVKNIASVYRTPLIEVSSTCALTNTTIVSAYRGAGRPEANYFMERLLDRAAREMNIDRIALRRRNLVKPAQMPFAAASGQVYDSGDFPAVLARTMEVGDYAGFAKRKRDSRKRHKLRGIAVSSFLEVTAPPGKELGHIRFEPDGTVSIITGTLDYGQGHATPFAQVLCDRLGIPFESVRLIQGDSDTVRLGGGTGGSRSVTASGQAIVEASALVVDKGKLAASHVLEAASSDIEFKKGRFVVAGTDRGIGIIELAARLRAAAALPDGVPSSLDVDHTSADVAATYPNGCHIAEVEIDPETGVVEVVRYAGVNDFGVIVNPMLVDGQIHGGVVQGIGQALMETARYDAEGQPITGSYMDYALPRAADVPFFTTGSVPSPAKTNPLGTKGCGEAGCAGALPAIVNAVLDALADHGVTELDMPLTSEKIWAAIHHAAR